MKFSPELQSATLIKRYKRFLADVTLPDGSELTMHCANTGAMTGCAEPGDTVWYSTSDNAKRKYPHSWELTETKTGDWIGINTARANHLAKDAIVGGLIPQLSGYAEIRSEVRYGEENSRIDLLLSDPDRADCYIEVKSVTLLGEDHWGHFPDAVTTRGQKHLRELMAMAAENCRAVLFFVVQHSGIQKVSVADFIDAKYASLLRQAMDSGVEVLAYGCDISPQGIEVAREIPFFIDGQG